MWQDVAVALHSEPEGFTSGLQQKAAHWFHPKGRPHRFVVRACDRTPEGSVASGAADSQ